MVLTDDDRAVIRHALRVYIQRTHVWEAEEPHASIGAFAHGRKRATEVLEKLGGS